MAKHTPLLSGIGVIFALGLLALSILSLVGLFYLTRYTFSATREDGKECVAVTTTERNIARLTVVLSWISIGLSVLGSVAFVSSSK